MCHTQKKNTGMLHICKITSHNTFCNVQFILIILSKWKTEINFNFIISQHALLWWHWILLSVTRKIKKHMCASFTYSKGLSPVIAICLSLSALISKCAQTFLRIMQLARAQHLASKSSWVCTQWSKSTYLRKN